jgi:cation diffusion facilitator family transporter
MSPQQRSALLSVLAAAALVAIKLVTGLAVGSLGLISEAMHSGTDLVAALLTFFALSVAGRPPDRDHPFGHGKAEHLAALGEAAFLTLVSGFIAYHSVSRLVSGEHGELDPGPTVFGVLGVVILIDLGRATASCRASRRYGSPALASNALHFASDLLGSAAVLVGLALVSAGYPEADAVAALFVGGLVVLAAFRLMRQNVEVLMDRSPADAELRVRGAIDQVEPGVEVRRVRVRQAAGRHFVDVVMGVRADAALGQGHAVADRVERAIAQAMPDSDVVVHVEPLLGAGTVRERVTGAALTVLGVHEVHNVRVALVGGRRELSLHLKLPGALELERAHDVASRVEERVREAVPEIDEILTHIEPLAAEDVELSTVGDDLASIEPRIREIVRRHDAEPAEIRLRRDGDGILAYITLAVDGHEPLADAHRTAMDVEIAVKALPQLAHAVVHTEPL